VVVVATEVAAAVINVTVLTRETRHLWLRDKAFLDSFQTGLGISLELLESVVFPFAS